jgi:hypothetical protein
VKHEERPAAPRPPNLGIKIGLLPPGEPFRAKPVLERLMVAFQVEKVIYSDKHLLVLIRFIDLFSVPGQERLYQSFEPNQQCGHLTDRIENG